MIDMENLSEWRVDKIVTAQGYTCEGCGAKQAIAFITISFQEGARKLARYTPGHTQFKFHFSKLLRKASGMVERMSEEQR